MAGVRACETVRDARLVIGWTRRRDLGIEVGTLSSWRCPPGVWRLRCAVAVRWPSVVPVEEACCRCWCCAPSWWWRHHPTAHSTTDWKPSSPGSTSPWRPGRGRWLDAAADSVSSSRHQPSSARATWSAETVGLFARSRYPTADPGRSESLLQKKKQTHSSPF